MGKQVSRKTRNILIICAAAFVAAAAAVLLGVLLTQLPKNGDNNNPQVGKRILFDLRFNLFLIFQFIVTYFWSGPNRRLTF